MRELKPIAMLMVLACLAVIPARAQQLTPPNIPLMFGMTPDQASQALGVQLFALQVHALLSQFTRGIQRVGEVGSLTVLPGGRPGLTHGQMRYVVDAVAQDQSERAIACLVVLEETLTG